jgi:predicted dinucleotide-binding enzyme
MKIGIIGAGVVGQTLGKAFIAEGHSVMLGTRNITKEEVVKWKQDHPTGTTGFFADTAKFGEVLVLAISGSVTEDAIKLAGPFNSVGSPFMYKPGFPGGIPTMFICGNDEEAKKTVTAILTSFGWETEDMGKVEAARAIEPLCMLWCIPGLLRNQWTHAFKLLKG